MSMKISVSIPVDLSPQEVRSIGERWLEQLTQGRWVRDGKLWDEGHTSHRFDYEVGDSTHPDFELVEAIGKLRQILKKREKR